MIWRAALAFVIAPAVVPLGLYLLVSATAVSSPESMNRAGVTYSVMFLVCYSLAMVVGMPMHRCMRDYNYNLLRHYLLGGALIGAIPGLALLVVGLPKLSIGILIPMMLASFVGAFSAALFWLIAVYDARSLRKAAQPY